MITLTLSLYFDFHIHQIALKEGQNRHIGWNIFPRDEDDNLNWAAPNLREKFRFIHRHQETFLNPRPPERDLGDLGRATPTTNYDERVRLYENRDENNLVKRNQPGTLELFAEQGNENAPCLLYRVTCADSKRRGRGILYYRGNGIRLHGPSRGDRALGDWEIPKRMPACILEEGSLSSPLRCRPLPPLRW